MSDEAPGTKHLVITAVIVVVAVAVNDDAGLALNVWTVNERDRIQDMAEIGVDGIITDVPELAREIVDES